MPAVTTFGGHDAGRTEISILGYALNFLDMNRRHKMQINNHCADSYHMPKNMMGAQPRTGTMIINAESLSASWMRTVLVVIALLGLLVGAEPGRLNDDPSQPGILMLDTLDLKAVATAGRTPKGRSNCVGKPLVIQGVTYPRGIGLSGTTVLRVDLSGGADRFETELGIDDQMGYGSLRGYLFADGRQVASVTTGARRIVRLEADLRGAKELVVVLAMDAGYFADLAGARLHLTPGAATTPRLVSDPAVAATEHEGPLLWLDGIDPLFISSGDGKRAGIKCTPTREPLSVGNAIVANGYAVYPRSRLCLDLDGGARALKATVGIQDGTKGGSAQFRVYRDGLEVFASGPMAAGDPARPVEVDLHGAQSLILAVDGDEAAAANRLIGVWVAPRLMLDAAVATRPIARTMPQTDMSIAAITDGPMPAIHGPVVTGASPGRPFLFRLPVTGARPMTYRVEGLPAGLSVDAATGVIAGTMTAPGSTVVRVVVRNAHGEARRPLTIRCVPGIIAFTPPMGWNHWNQWAWEIDDAKVRAAIQVMLTTGLADHGYAYVNIDDHWQGARGPDGILASDPVRFPDMKRLGDDLHALGLKFGIYSSPGARSCGKQIGSLDHQEQDAKTWASWGVDYLKYDACSANGRQDLPQLWRDMRKCLDATGRDIVYSTNTCRDLEAGAQLWRTTDDIRNNWISVSQFGFELQRGLEDLARPGRYNDPDMLVVGNPKGCSSPVPLTRNEQITHITLWAMAAAPLLLGYDLTKTDAFLYSLLANDDVLAVDQDPLVRQGRCVRTIPPVGLSDKECEVWTRPLFDGRTAVAIFNRGCAANDVHLAWADLGIVGPQAVRDAWRRTDLGDGSTGFTGRVEAHAAVLLLVGSSTTDIFRPAP